MSTTTPVAWDRDNTHMHTVLFIQLLAWSVIVQGQVRNGPKAESQALEILLKDQPGPTLFGASIARVADCDGDGLEDFAVGAPGWTSGAGDKLGAVLIVSVRNGRLIRLMEGYSPDSRFGRVKDLGDVDGDGVRDFSIASLVEVVLVSGSSLDVQWRVSGADHCVGNIGDMNRDGVADVLLWSSSTKSPKLCSGADGAQLDMELPSGSVMAILEGVKSSPARYIITGGKGKLRIVELPSGFTREIPNLEGYDGTLISAQVYMCDEQVRLVIGIPGMDMMQGVVKVYSFDDWQLAFTLRGSELVKEPLSGEPELGSAVCIVEDQDDDGCQDLMVAAPGYAWGASVRCVSGRDGKLIWSIAGSWRFGSALCRADDVDGDGIDDFLISTYRRHWEGGGINRVHLFGSAKHDEYYRITDIRSE